MKDYHLNDSPFFRLMGAIGDLVVLNILWLLCCLPVVTAGASTLALFAIVHKIAAGEDYRTAAGFFKAFRRDFKQATALGMAALMRPAVARMEQAGRKPEPPRDPFEEEQTDGEDDLT